jgi:hypothetical protein
LIRIFDRDLKAAGIAKRDERGRTLDVHALRTTFGTLLSKGGVPLRTAQAAMRHSDPSLTANVYTDPKLLDVHGALDALPSLPLDGGPTAEPERARATGTDTQSPGAVAPLVAPNWCNGRQTAGTDGKMQAEPSDSSRWAGLDANPGFDEGRATLAIAGNASTKWAMRDSNPRHPACKAPRSYPAKSTKTPVILGYTRCSSHVQGFTSDCEELRENGVFRGPSV